MQVSVFCPPYSHPFSVTGLILSTVLLYAIWQFSGAHFGAYKNLLTAFAVTDMFLVIQHAAVHPVSSVDIAMLIIIWRSEPFSLATLMVLLRTLCLTIESVFLMKNRWN